MADAWGIEPTYLDAGGTERTVAPDTIAALRAVIGDPLDAATTAPGPPPGRVVAPAAPTWGWAVQLYAARRDDGWGIGDLTSLRRLARWAASQGAGYLLVSPLGAGAPAGPQQPSPYFPATRRFRSPLHLDVTAVPGASAAAAEVERAVAAAAALRSATTIDRDAIWRLQRRALEAIWRAQGDGRDLDAWAAERPGVAAWGAWCALAERHGPDARRWPAAAAHPGASEAQAAARSDAARFHVWLQRCLDEQLATAAAELALVQDLPIGFDPGGFDAWEWQDVVARGVTVGAPPDEFNVRGQDWGLPPFSPAGLVRAGLEPFTASIRAAMAPGGGLRIDHVMGLFRLWWIPEGADPAEGAYVRYPAADLLRIVAAESRAAGAFVVGEDLGTVEASARRALMDHGILSTRLLWFEEEAPERWPEGAMAAVTTHDLPTVVGRWDGSDLDEQRRCGLDPNEAGEEAIRRDLAEAGELADGASSADAVLAAHRLLARAPSVLRCATLDDALGAPRRPNIPGADGARPNWCLPLPEPIDALERSDLAAAIARALGAR